MDLKPGDVIRRLELHERYGGRRQGGISPSKVSANVFLFTDQARGALHGYIYDGAHSDGTFHYTGEGQYGDQRMVQGNRAIRDHHQEARDLHVFDVRNGQATYLGQFEYVDHYSGDAPETGDGETRKVIVFRLRRLSGDTPLAPSRVEDFGSGAVKEVPIEQHLTERMVINPSAEPREGERREQKLVRELRASLLANGHEVCRLQLQPRDEPAPLFCDLFDKTENALVEAKGSVARPAIRMAIGQLADYAQLAKGEPKKVLLLPEEPRQNLLRLLASQEIEARWPDGDGGFVSAP